MRAVQEHLMELDKDKLIDIYIDVHGGGYITDPELADMSAKEIRESMRMKLSGFIDELRTMPVTQSNDGRTCILLAHRISRGCEDEIVFSLVRADDVLEDIDAVESYGYELQDRSEIMGYLVSDAPLTKRYIYHLMADVIHETTFFGLEQEDIEEAREDLERRIAETENEGSIPFEKFKKEMLEDLDEYDQGVFLDEPSADERELLEKIVEA